MNIEERPERPYSRALDDFMGSLEAEERMHERRLQREGVRTIAASVLLTCVLVIVLMVYMRHAWPFSLLGDIVICLVVGASSFAYYRFLD